MAPTVGEGLGEATSFADPSSALVTFPDGEGWRTAALIPSLNRVLQYDANIFAYQVLESESETSQSHGISAHARGCWRMPLHRVNNSDAEQEKCNDDLHPDALRQARRGGNSVTWSWRYCLDRCR